MLAECILLMNEVWNPYGGQNIELIGGVDEMTMNYERRNAVNRTKEFLWSLMDPKKTPRIPKEIRAEARSCLKHYPSDYDMERAADQAPEIFGDWEYYKND